MFSVFGLKIFSGSLSEAVSKIFRLADKKSVYICVTGAHGLVQSQRNKQVLFAHDSADLIVPDGMPLVWIGKLSGKDKTERIYGPDLMLEICRQAAVKKLRVFFYGTTEPTLRKLSEKLRQKFSGLTIAGCYSPPFRPLTESEEKKVVWLINKSRPQIIFVGLSTPKQELWMRILRPQLEAPIIVGVGAAFDFLSGTKRQAPVWLRRIGLEWFFRLLTEPKRLGKRYFVTNTHFFWYLLVWFIRKLIKL